MFEQLLNPGKSRWPQKDDRLLRPADPAAGVYFADDKFSRQTFLWTGYMLAGEALVKASLEDLNQRNYLIYPILYNYRHGIETALKWTLNQYSRYSSAPEYEKNHLLLDLWKLCKIVIFEVGGIQDQEADLAVEQVIIEFQNIDPRSLSFRYADTHAGEMIDLPAYAVDLENLRDVMKGIDNYFTGLDGLLDDNARSGYFDR